MIEKGKKRKYCTWVVEFDNQSRLETWFEILNYFGADGWELVNVIPQHWGGGLATYHVDSYLAIFKRRVLSS